MMKTVIIADDHPFMLKGVAGFVEKCGYTVVGSCKDGIMAFRLIKSHQPDIAILDINMPGLNGLELVKRIKEGGLPTRSILLTLHRDKGVYKQAVSNGVYGYLLKDYAEEELENCLLAVSEGRTYTSPSLLQDLKPDYNPEAEELSQLTAAERKIIGLIAQDKTTKQIAQLLFVSEKTIEGHRRNIIQKLGLPKEKNSLLKWALGRF